jgi:trigger factor
VHATVNTEPEGLDEKTGDFVVLEVTVTEDELAPMVDQAWREIAAEVKLPGFRPGRAPRKLLEAQLGSDYARAEALRKALPEFYAEAAITHDVDVIAPPELSITSGEESGDLTFTATVEVRPTVVVAGYDGLRVEVPSPVVTDDEVDAQVDRIRSQYGELVAVERAAGEGDYVQIDIHGTRDDEPVEGLTADDYKYLVGSGLIAPEFDEHLRGASVGDVVQFSAAAPGGEDEEPVDFRLLVKGVEERVLPELTDEWAAEATEFDTVEELRDDLRSTAAAQHVQSRLQGLAYQLQGRGIALEDYLRITGRDPETFTAELQEASDEAVRTDLALRAVAVAEGLEVDEDEIDHEIVHLIGDADVTVEEAREQLQSEGQLSAVRSQLLKRAAMEWLVQHAEVVDPDGVAVPAELLEPPEHDHDHDHD